MPQDLPMEPVAAGPLPVGTMHFCVADVPERERLATFREHFGRSVLRYDMEPLRDIDLAVDLRFRMLPGLALMAGRMHGSRNARTPATLAEDATDDLGLVVNLRGPHRIVQRGRELVLGDGEATLVALAESCSFTHLPPGDILALRVPRLLLAPILTGADDRCLRLVPAASPALALLRRYSRLALSDEQTATPEIAALMASHLRDLMAAAVGAAPAACREGLAAALLTDVKAEIERRLTDPTLSIGDVCRSQGCTPRHLQRLLAAEGATFTSYVLGRRLAHAHRQLTDPLRAGVKITAIALDAGFGDLSYFNRAFRRSYGATPGEVRAAALT